MLAGPRHDGAYDNPHSQGDGRQHPLLRWVSTVVAELANRVDTFTMHEQLTSTTRKCKECSNITDTGKRNNTKEKRKVIQENGSLPKYYKTNTPEFNGAN